jgi:hypothetical protein
MYENQDIELAQVTVNELRAEEERDIQKYGVISVNTEIRLERALERLAELEAAEHSRI